ncbi:hypothetical protein V495_08033 [Pseudogymnoascus sp. VKM F-4514 (FW-929)]|nr:hypothetical protein V495_08033 [Pseudogymnoascus sp. VKM F-4514 (FW-929)]
MGPTPRHEEYIEPSLALAPIPAFPGTHRHHHRHDYDGTIVRVERIRDADYRRDERGEVVLYEGDDEVVEPVAAVRRDRKGPNPRAVRAMMKFVT